MSTSTENAGGDKLCVLTSAQPCRHFSLAEIQSATEDFDDKLIIGQGGFGKVYRGHIDIEETSQEVAIKRLDPMSNQGADEFRVEINMLSKLRHCHLVSLIGFCDDNKEMILVYVYIPRGSLHDHLHKADIPLTWIQRLKIAIGAARGLDYLHTGVGTQHGVIHRDVKSSNILLDENWAAMISDFGLCKMCPTNQLFSHVDASVKGTFGYLDPEYFYTRKLTRKTDVYAFGVVLFELLSGRLPVDDRNAEDQCSLVRWAQKCVQERKLDQLVDSSIRGTICVKGLRGFVKIAERCLCSVLKQRPTMAEVVVSLQALQELQQRHDNSPEPTTFTWKIHKYLVSTTKQNSGISLETCRIPLEEIIRATKNFSSETQLGDGGFGMVYRGQLFEHWENRLVAIKRLHPNRCHGNIEFNNELEMVSNFNHPNIIPFIGYCDDANEKIVVYEYASNRSLDHHLQDPNKRRCLTWAQRLKICLGVARGIKYMHSGVGEHKRVIHRDVKSENILLDDNLEAKIWGVGLPRLSPRNQPATKVCTWNPSTMFYIDPAYNKRGRLSKESDIYSFGVVMFEMSSGMMAYKATRFRDTEEQYLIDIVRSYYVDHEYVDGLDKLIDTTIEGQIDMRSFHIFNNIAHQCINLDIMKRPTMDRIIKGLKEALDTQVSGEKFHMLGAKDLLITWQNDPRYWKWGHILESRFPKVWILTDVCWLKIEGKIAAVMLSQKGTYVAYLVFRTTMDCKGLDVPARSKVIFGGIEMETENVYLQRPRDVKENYVVPQRRKDGWMEIKLGEFEYKEGDDGEVRMVIKEVTRLNWKSGLIVEGIEIRPK